MRPAYISSSGSNSTGVGGRFGDAQNKAEMTKVKKEVEKKIR